ncbi:pentapeptide repeat-containing protein [Arthrobacter sp. D3-16]
MDFAIDKPAETACQNLDSEFSCTIHDSLRPRGFRGCTVFDCFGAGQNVSQNLFQGISWKADPGTAKDMFPAFKVVRQLHEMLWYLTEATNRTFDPDTSHHVNELRMSIEDVMGDTQQVLSLNLGDMHARVRSVLMDVSEEVRSSFLATGDDHLDVAFVPGADLMGKKMKSRSLRGADLRGAYLIATDLRGCDLSGADLLGSDLRDARLEGADLSKTLYLTQAQLNAAQGDAHTLLPSELDSPTHWRINS